MADQPGSDAGPVRPVVAVVFATVAFIALLIFGLGMLSLALNEDVIQVPGLGQIPGVIATIAAALAFAATLYLGVRRAATVPPSFWFALWAAVACALGYVVGLWLGAVFTGADVASAAAASGRIATSWFGVIVAGAGAVSAWGGIALVRTRSGRPRWPWEDEFDE